jgi:long-chain fatty acid transport protein
MGGVAAVGSLVVANAALAGSFALREQSAQGLGQSFAGAAAGGGGLTSMFWNPATITQFEGMTSSWTGTGFVPYAKIDPSAATKGFMTTVARGSTLSAGGAEVGPNAFSAASASSVQINNWLWLGLNVTAPFGLVTKAPSNWAGQLYERTSKVFSTDVNPTVAIKLNDMISVGLGVRAVYFKVKLSGSAPSSANPLLKGTALLPGAGSATLQGDDWAFGWNAGVTFTPFSGTTLGVGYRSQVKPNLDGSLITPYLDQPIKVKITLPDSVNVGLRQRITDRFTLLAGYEWTHWSTFNSFPAYFTAQPLAGRVATTLAFRYRNSWFTSIGGEYKIDNNWTVRAGLGYEKSPITKTNRSPRLPDSDRIWTSIGASYQFNNKLTLDVSYAHLFGKRGKILIDAAHPAYSGMDFAADTKTHLDIFSAGLTYRWDDPKVTQGTLPLVRKY